MNKTKKILALVLSVFMLVAISVVGTVAYLTSTDTVNNTFTVGNVTITLDETDVDTAGVPEEGADRVMENDYHLIPGHEYTKDPTIHVAANSEACYVFVKVENGLSAIEPEAGTDATIAEQMEDNGWTLISEGSNIYKYNAKVEKAEINQDLPVFETLTVKDDATNEELAECAKTIKVTACAIQAEGFADAAAAYAKLPSDFIGTTAE